MRIGIFSKTFAAADVDGVFAAVRDCGYQAVQFNFSSAGLPSLPTEIPEAAVAAVRAASQRHGIRIEAISATFNLTHPDAGVVERGMESLRAIAAAAGRLDCPLATLCTGTMDAEDQWRRHPENSSPAAWKALRAGIDKAAAIAGEHGIRLGIEPEQANIVDSARKARLLLDEAGTDRLRIIFDPANLFEPGLAPADRRAILDEAFDLLGNAIAIAHAKDRAPDGSFVAAGKGVLDYPYFIAGLRAYGFQGCVVTHGLTADEAPGVRDMLRGFLSD